MNHCIYLHGILRLCNIPFSPARQKGWENLVVKLQAFFFQYNSLRDIDPTEALELAVKIKKQFFGLTDNSEVKTGLRNIESRMKKTDDHFK